MSFENGGNNPRLNTQNTIYAGHQGNVNQGFYPDHPETPPPNYEEVISGDYLKRTDITYNHSLPRTDDHLSSVTCDFTNPQTYITQPHPAPEEQNEGHTEEIKCLQKQQPETHLRQIIYVIPSYNDSRRKMAIIAVKVIILLLVITAFYEILSDFGKFD